MTDLPAFAPAAPAPTLRVSTPTLALALPTAMLLVDYALRDKPTPTPGPRAVAGMLPNDLVKASEPVRAVLGHGAALRPYLAATLPAGHPGHREWAALRAWLTDEADSEAMLATGADENLAYGDQGGYPVSDQERALVARSETADTAGRLALRVEAALWGWRLPDPGARARWLLTSDHLRQTLVTLLDFVWDGWFGEAWEEALPALDAAAANPPPVPRGGGGAQWVSAVTGLRPHVAYARAADEATVVTCLPCPELAHSLAAFPMAGELWVAYTPEPGRQATGLSVGTLAKLGAAVEALGDRNRLALLLELAAHGAQPMQRLAALLDVHQSTVSRQVATLRKAGLVWLDDDRRVAIDVEVVRDTCDTLKEALT
ncbi:MAG: helix-turn-helix domain-containing protein [Mycobacteriales bacterium]